MLARNSAEIDRSVTNVRDATDWANKLAQKIFTNPFVLSPFYKPSHEDLRVQGIYDTALVFTKGAQELRDAVKTSIPCWRGRPHRSSSKRSFNFNRPSASWPTSSTRSRRAWPRHSKRPTPSGRRELR